MEFLDLFNKDNDEEVELKPGVNHGQQSYSGPGTTDNNIKDDEGSKRERKEASLFPTLEKSQDKKTKGRSKSLDSKQMKRIEGKLDKMLKQNKMILEKLEKMDGGSSNDTVW